MGRRRRSKFGRIIARYWGYLVLLIVIYGLLIRDFGPIFLVAGSGVALLYMLFAAPMWCMATTRKGEACRNNSYGFLIGCTQYREHTWERIKMLVKRQRWAKFWQQVWTGAGNRAAALGVFISLATGIIGAIKG